MIIEIKHSTSTAHIITGHPGKCNSLHGHNYNFTIGVSSPNLNALGMVVDFSILKNKVKYILDEMYDHKAIVYKKDPRAEVLTGIGAELVDYNPTAEKMARKVYFVLCKEFEKDEELADLCVSYVKVEETENNSAIVRGEYLWVCIP